MGKPRLIVSYLGFTERHESVEILSSQELVAPGESVLLVGARGSICKWQVQFLPGSINLSRSVRI